MKKLYILTIITILVTSCAKEKIETNVDTSQNPTLVSISVDGKISNTVVVR